MFNDQIESWRREHYAALANWCEQAKTSFDAIVQEIISSEQIADEDFVSIVKLVMLAGNFTQTELSQITTVASGRIGLWQNGADLPESELRQHVLMLFCKSLHTNRAPKALVQMTNVMDIKNPPHQEKTCSDGEMYELFWRKISELDLSIRSVNCIENDNIVYVGELVSKTEAELLRTPNFGQKSLAEIKEVLGVLGLRLGMKNSVIDAFRKDLGTGKIGPTPVD